MSLTVCLSFDWDTITLWRNGKDATSVSRGEFGAHVIPRILDLLKKYDVPATFFVPGMSAKSYPDMAKAIVDAGHEIGHHGFVHENPLRLDRDGEKEALVRGLEALDEVLGLRPTGWRSPGWAISEHTLPLLAEHGFVYDSSLMGNDFELGWARNAGTFDLDAGIYATGSESELVEVPIY